MTNDLSFIPDEDDQIINYTAFNKIKDITEANYSLAFTYGADHQRRKTVLTEGGAIIKTKYFLGAYEEEITVANGTRKIHYISGGDGLAAVFIMDNANPAGKMYYTYADHLGSIVAITDDTGGLLEEYSYGPWGRRRNAETWEPIINSQLSIINGRGYTGHEHLPEFGLINMNGRLYDPILGRMLSPDNFIQAPGYTQNYNRYSYVLNNPLMYTDPSGESIIGTIIMTGIIIYSAYQGGRAVNNGESNPNNWNWNSGSTYIGVIGGGLVGWASYGVGAEMIAGGGFMANTMSFIAASHVNSVGMGVVTGGKTDYTLNFGFGSYNFTRSEYDGLFDGEAEWSDILYGIGFLGNLGDVATIIDSKINMEKNLIDKMQNYSPNGELDRSSQNQNLDGLTYSGPEKGGPLTLKGDPYFGPIDNPNFVDATGFQHDIARKTLNSRGWKNLVYDNVGLKADWQFTGRNFFLGTKNLFRYPSLSWAAYKNGIFFTINKTAIYYGVQQFRSAYGF